MSACVNVCTSVRSRFFLLIARHPSSFQPAFFHRGDRGSPCLGEARDPEFEHSRNENNARDARAARRSVPSSLSLSSPVRRNRDFNSSRRRRALCARVDTIVQGSSRQREARFPIVSGEEKKTVRKNGDFPRPSQCARMTFRVHITAHSNTDSSFGGRGVR